MSLVPLTRLLSDALRGGYAVCYCESWNLESLAGVLDAAEEARSPVIVGFNGGFLAHPQRARPENVAYYAGMGLALAEAAAAFLLNETDDFCQISRGVRMGFNAVMVENERLGADEYRRLVEKVVEMAHGAGAAVEAAVGHLPDASGAGHAQTHLTDPAAAKAFVEATGIDALAVSVGNVHILTQGKAEIDLDALKRIRDAVSVPLVLHGGTGIPMELARDFIRSGVAKINFGTVLKQVYLAAVREKLAGYREPSSPHPFLGMGGGQDVLMAGREAVRMKVQELLAVCGSAGKASRARD